MPRRGRKDKTKGKPTVAYAMRYVIPETEEVQSKFAPISLPILRRETPMLLASQLKSVTPLRYEDLTPEEKVRWDEREADRKYRDANTVDMEYTLGAHGSHELSGDIKNINDTEAYIPWEWLRTRVPMDNIEQFMIPVDKYNHEMHTISENSSEFKEFLTKYQDGDEIWLYKNNGFHCLAGRAGWVIIRDSKLVTVFQTCMS